MTTQMIRGLLVATAAAALLAASSAHAADKPPPVTASVGTALNAVQKAAAAKDWATAKAKLDEASKGARTPYDNYMVSEFTRMVDANTQDMAGAATAAQAMVDSPAEPAADRPQDLKFAISLSLETKDYDKAVADAKLLSATNPTDADSRSVIDQAFYFGKDYPDAISSAQTTIDNQVKAGQKPDRHTLELMLNAQVALKDEPGAEKTLEMLVANFNDPNDWQQMIDVAFSTKGLRDVDAIWLGRLLFLSGATVSSSDATMIGSTASHLTFFGDAQVAQNHGGTGFPDANASADKDKKTIAAQIAAGQKQSGQYNAKLAEALYSYGMYPEAEAAARLAIQKGGATDSSEPSMVLAQALIVQGKYDDGIAALGQVTGGGPATPRIVRLWVDYANLKKAPPAAAPAAAAAAH